MGHFQSLSTQPVPGTIDGPHSESDFPQQD